MPNVRLIRLGITRAISIELTRHLTQPDPTVTTTHPPGGQIIATVIPELGVVGSINRFSFFQDLIDDLAMSHRRRPGRYVGFDLRPIDRHDPRLHQPFSDAQPHHLGEHTGDRVLMTVAEPSQRGMIRLLIRCDHPERDIFTETLHDTPARALSRTIRIQQDIERDPWVIRCTAPTIGPQ